VGSSHGWDFARERKILVRPRAKHVIVPTKGFFNHQLKGLGFEQRQIPTSSDISFITTPTGIPRGIIDTGNREHQTQ
jgi:hypothetical protein